jgi:hypothetical protein
MRGAATYALSWQNVAGLCRSREGLVREDGIARRNIGLKVLVESCCGAVVESPRREGEGEGTARPTFGRPWWLGVFANRVTADAEAGR